MKILMILMFIPFQIMAQDSSGCGEYSFKGVLKIDESSKEKLIYVVHEKTNSEMKFEIPAAKDVSVIAPFLDVPTSLKGRINSKMDGTKGILSSVSEVRKRLPNPLVAGDTELKLIKADKCQ